MNLFVQVLFSFGLVASTSAMAVDNIVNGFAGADAGDWGGKKGAVIGPADDTCANMGAVGKVNLVSNFGFAIPGDATITELRAFTKAGASSLQDVGVQLATDATVDPPVVIGNEVLYPFPDVGSGNCAVTIVSDVGDGLGFWGLGSLAPSDVNNPAFGMVFIKQETSEIKVDSICMQINYLTDEGPAVIESCFAVPTPQNTITVVKDVIGAAPGSDWAYSGTLGAFTLQAGGGFESFTDLADGSYTITETTKPGYTVTSECLIGGAVVSSGAASVSVEIADEVTATCIFTNTLNTSTGTFTVHKNFVPDHTDAVLMTLECSSGDIEDNPLPATQLLPAEFTITGFLPDATCTAIEAPTPGYDQDISGCQAGGLLADGGSCTMINTQREGTFTVRKDFSDDNCAFVDMTLTCTSGTVTVNPLGASENSPAEFEVTGFLLGATCTATEAELPGYDQDESGCQVGGLSAAGGSCTMINTLDANSIEVAIDIKFCNDPNAFNCKKKGVLPVTIFGTNAFDVEDIDINSLQLCTEDLLNCTNAPRNWSVEDRGDPNLDLGAAMCAVIEVEEGIFEEQDYLNQDGFLDLDAAFEAREVQDMLGIFCASAKGTVSEALVITGSTFDGVQMYSVPFPSVGVDQLWKVNK